MSDELGGLETADIFPRTIGIAWALGAGSFFLKLHHYNFPVLFQC